MSTDTPWTGWRDIRSTRRNGLCANGPPIPWPLALLRAALSEDPPAELHDHESATLRGDALHRVGAEVTSPTTNLVAGSATVSGRMTVADPTAGPQRPRLVTRERTLPCHETSAERRIGTPVSLVSSTGERVVMSATGGTFRGAGPRSDRAAVSERSQPRARSSSRISPSRWKLARCPSSSPKSRSCAWGICSSSRCAAVSGALASEPACHQVSHVRTAARSTSRQSPHKRLLDRDRQGLLPARVAHDHAIGLGCLVHNLPEGGQRVGPKRLARLGH